MCENTKGTRMVRLCYSDALYTGAGHPLSEIKYEYDEEGYIAGTKREFYYTEFVVHPLMGLSMRETIRDAYGIIVAEVFFGEDGKEFKVPRTVIYEKDEKGLVRRATTSITQDGEETGMVYYISGYGKYLRRRALKAQLTYLEPDGTYSHECRYQYDKCGWRTRIESRGHPESPFTPMVERTIQYDECGSPIRYSLYEIENTYDEDGFLQVALVWGENPNTGEWEIRYRHVYTYGNYAIGSPDSETKE